MKTDFSVDNIIPGKGTFYAFKSKTAKKLVDHVTISNGLAWSADEKKLFYIDSFSYRVDSFDYDAEKEELSTCHLSFD